jgi:hypothetical protein
MILTRPTPISANDGQLGAEEPDARATPRENRVQLVARSDKIIESSKEEAGRRIKFYLCGSIIGTTSLLRTNV